MKYRFDSFDMLETLGWIALWIAAAACLFGVGYFATALLDYAFNVFDAFESLLIHLHSWWYRG